MRICYEACEIDFSINYFESAKVYVIRSAPIGHALGRFYHVKAFHARQQKELDKYKEKFEEASKNL